MKDRRYWISSSLGILMGFLIFPMNIEGSEIVRASQQFLGSLDKDQKELASFDWNDKSRKDWHFIPKTRKGLPIKDLAQDQQHLGYALINLCMSREGSLESLTIMSFEQILWELENKAPHRDSSMYHFSFFGKVSEEGTWGLSIEGHHLSLNFTINNGELISATPSFYGTNPDIILSGPRKGNQILDEEQSIAFELIQSLSVKQKQKAIISGGVPRDILTAAKQKVEILNPRGIGMSDLNGKQKRLLMRLIREYVFRHTNSYAVKEWQSIKEDDTITFSWVGSPEQFKPHYYRVQGKDFVIEYANTQNNANHAHAVYRRPGNDFGESYLSNHLKNHN